jgi:hypothetical protein
MIFAGRCSKAAEMADQIESFSIEAFIPPLEPNVPRYLRLGADERTLKNRKIVRGLAAMRTVDPITLSTTWHYIQRVCREIRETAERTATNVLVVTLHDLAYGIWDAEGRAIAIPEGFPPRLISSTFPIRKTMKKFEGRTYPGDVFLANMPSDGAVHLGDSPPAQGNSGRR